MAESHEYQNLPKKCTPSAETFRIKPSASKCPLHGKVRRRKIGNGGAAGENCGDVLPRV